MKRMALMWILWPSFLAAAGASAAVFAFIDPHDISIFGYLQFEREPIYTMTFFIFWVMAALSSALSLHIAPRVADADDTLGNINVKYKI